MGHKATSVEKYSAARILALLLFVLSPTVARSQHPQLDTLLKIFKSYRTVASSEKIYAHLDKHVCLVGETIWFSLYLVNESTHRPGGLSKVAYIDIVDAYNHPVIQSKVGLKDGRGNGQLFIPASVTTGRYSFRVYTNWMKNFEVEAFFHKELSIINAFKEPDTQLKVTAPKDSIRFFPEGGNLVRGLRSRVAFKFTNPIDNRNAFLLNQSNDTLASIKADTLGMGYFYFTPTGGQQYHVSVPFGNNFVPKVKLPEILDYGYVLTVSDSTKEKIALHITANVKAATPPTVLLLIHARNMISVASSHVLSNGSVTVMVNKNDLYEGISHITLFDPSLNPVCERLLFSPVKRKLEIHLSSSQQEYGMRRKVAIDVTASDEQKQNVSAKLSMAVYQVDSLQQYDDANIFNYIWLNSDIPEAPNLPADFFSGTSERRKSIMDNIMLVNGWRKFKWQSVLKQPPVVSFSPEVRGHIITGKVTNSQSPSKYLTTYLSSPGLNIQLYGCVSDANGIVEFEMKDFYGPRKIVVQTNFNQDSLSRVNISNAFSDKFAKLKYRPFTITPNIEWTLESRSVAMQVQDIFYRDLGARSRGESVDTTAFYGDASQTFYLDDYTRFPVMEEILREYVPGVIVRKRKDGFHFYNTDMNHNKVVFTEDPLIMLDGIPIFDADKILAFDPLKVKKLEVFTRRYYKGALSFPGIVSFTTYNGDLGNFQLDPKCVVMDYEGLQLQREFYAPTYENNKQRESRMPDQRNLLYWSPEITTDASGKRRVEFFTSDREGTYRISIEGITESGQAGGGAGSFMVKSFEN